MMVNDFMFVVDIEKIEERRLDEGRSKYFISKLMTNGKTRSSAYSDLQKQNGLTYKVNHVIQIVRWYGNLNIILVCSDSMRNIIKKALARDNHEFE